MFTNMIEGWYHMNQRQDVWMRISKACYKKGSTSLRELGEIMKEVLGSPAGAGVR